jgi:hypothetical protein
MAFAKTLPAAWFALGLAAAVLPAHRHSAVGRMVDPRTYPSEKNRVQTLCASARPVGPWKRTWLSERKNGVGHERA